MSTSLLYHAWGISGYEYVHTRYETKKIIFKVVQSSQLRCPCCRHRKVKKKGTTTRQFKAVPIGFQKAVFIELDVQRIECLKCGVIRQVKVIFAKPKRRFTRAFERCVLELSRHMTISAVSQLLRTSWDTIKEIQKQYLKRRYKAPKLGSLTRIAIDEIHLGKKTGYLTVVLDLKTGVIVEVANGKSSESLVPFWKRLKRSGAKIEVVATDMSKAFIKAVSENLPEAQYVFDHFHIIKLFNDKLSKLRRAVSNEASELEKSVLKGTRWLLLKVAKNLSVEKEEHLRLQAALKMNEPLMKAYYMKEDLRQIWLQEDKESAAFVLDEWIKKAAVSGVRMLCQFAKTLAMFRLRILTYYDFDGISTGPLEGANNKIKTLQKMAYGFRDLEFLKLKIKSMHESKNVATIS